MRLAKIESSASVGVDALAVEVEVDISRGLPAMLVVGLPDAAVKESRDRVRTAIKNSGYAFPSRRITVNLAPADLRKEGPAFDLPIALAMLLASSQVEGHGDEQALVVGELALDGRVRPVPGVLPAAMLARSRGLKTVIAPAENAAEAGVIPELEVYGVSTLAEAVGVIAGQSKLRPVRVEAESLLAEEAEAEGAEFDFADVRGQEYAKRALVVAAAGAHNIIMIGPPGAGKSMMARRIPTILSLMTLEESVETTRVHSVMGVLAPGKGLLGLRPFRAPHHTASYAGLVGGGGGASGAVKPGEVSLAHNGVLFLDEFPELDRRAKEALREPLESGRITISRAATSLTFPARFMLIAAMNPCPCGYYGDPRRECRCTPHQIQSYLNRVSGPLFDRIDIHVEVSPVPYSDLASRGSGLSSAEMRKEVGRARSVQNERFRSRGFYSNAQIPDKLLREFCRLDTASERLLKQAMTELGLSARAYTKVLRVSRTIADLEGSEAIGPHNVSEAIQYRALDRSGLI